MKSSRIKEYWIARDKSERLNLYSQCPIREEQSGVFVPQRYWLDYIELDITDFPQVTWENSPQRVRIELMEE